MKKELIDLLNVYHLSDIPAWGGKSLYSFENIASSQIGIYIKPDQCVVIDGHEIVSYYKLKNGQEITLLAKDILKSVPNINFNIMEESSFLVKKILSKHKKEDVYPSCCKLDYVKIYRIKNSLHYQILERNDFSAEEYDSSLVYTVEQALLEIVFWIKDTLPLITTKDPFYYEFFSKEVEQFSSTIDVILNSVQTRLPNKNFELYKELLTDIDANVRLFSSSKKLDILLNLLDRIYEKS